MSKIIIPKSKLWTPDDLLPRCFRCGRAIRKDEQLKKRLWTIGGKPICTGCLTLHYPKAGKMDYDKRVNTGVGVKRYIQDLKERFSFIKKHEKDEKKRVQEIAAASQERAERADPKTRSHK